MKYLHHIFGGGAVGQSACADLGAVQGELVAADAAGRIRLRY